MQFHRTEKPAWVPSWSSSAPLCYHGYLWWWRHRTNAIETEVAFASHSISPDRGGVPPWRETCMPPYGERSGVLSAENVTLSYWLTAGPLPLTFDLWLLTKSTAVGSACALALVQTKRRTWSMWRNQPQLQRGSSKDQSHSRRIERLNTCPLIDGRKNRMPNTSLIYH